MTQELSCLDVTILSCANFLVEPSASLSHEKHPQDLGGSLVPFLLPVIRPGERERGPKGLDPAVVPQVTFLGSGQGLAAALIVFISNSGGNQQFSFALTTPTASTVVLAHTSFLFTLNKEKQKLF